MIRGTLSAFAAEIVAKNFQAALFLWPIGNKNGGSIFL